jgi:ABC-type nitrate/sulfonate/bicarbonate transport system permease component
MSAPASSAPATTTSGVPQIPRPRSRRALTLRQKIIISVLNLAAFFTVWELAARFTGIPPLFLPALTDVFAQYGAMHSEDVLLNNVWISVRTYLIGMAISLAIAIPGGLLIGGIKLLDRVLSPYMWTLYTLPRIILMPIVLLWLGYNRTATLVLVVLSAVPATIVFVMDGVKTADASLVRAARSFGADRRRLFTHVVMPSTLPFIATGVRMGVARGLLGLYIGEIFTGATGIGYILTLAFKTFNSPRTFAMLLLFVLFSVFMVGLTQALERKASVWKATDV